ncbi:hydrolase TatD family [Clostridium sp. CAG:813]|nr:hydrolase TatD family [Clostridium sp. CAG:813]
MHCFSGSLEFARECIKEGIYIALGGIYIALGGVVTFKNAKKTKEVAKNIPLEYLLLETDDPYLAPVPFRGKENQPMYVKYVAEEIANLRGITPEEVAKTSTENAKKIFKNVEF